MTTAAEFQTKVAKTATNMDRLDGIVNGGPAVDVTTDGGLVPSVAHLFANIQAEADEIIEGLGSALNLSELLGSFASGTRTATGTEPTLTVSEPVTIAGTVTLLRNGGSYQRPNVDYIANGTNVLTLTDPLEVGESIYWLHTGGTVVASGIAGIVTPEMFLAIGNGVADDTAAWVAAIATGKVVWGRPGAVYRVTGLNVANARIMYARFLDTRTTTTRKTLYASSCAFVSLDKVTVDIGTNGAVGGLDTASAIDLTDVAEVDLDVKVTGFGKGAGVRLTRCGGMLKAYCYDMTAGTPGTARPSDDMLQGIHLIQCKNLKVYPRWDRIGTVWTGQASVAWAYSRGLAVSGGDGIDIFAPHGTYADQHIDISGDLNAGRVTIHGGSLSYGRYFGCKIANTGSRIRVNNLHVYRMGLTAFVVSSTNDGTIPEADQPFDVRFVDCISEETGYDQAGYAYGGSALSASTGGKIEVGDEYLTWPRGVRFIRHRVIGGGLTDYSFIDQTSEYNDPENPGVKLVGNVGPYRNRVEDWVASGCVISNAPVGFLTGRSKVSMTAPVSLPNGGSPTLFTFNQEPDNGLMLLRTSVGSAGSATAVTVRYSGRFLVTIVVVYDPNGTGDRRAELGVNGVLSGNHRVDQRAAASLETTVRLTTSLTLSAGDTLSVAGLQDSGGALNASASLEITDLKNQTGEAW